MKKILCLVLSLMLLALCPAMAENAVEELRMQVLTSPNGDYSFEVPETYFTMDAEWFASLMGQEEFQKLLSNMMGLEDPSMLETYIQMMEASNMMIVYAPDFFANLNVQAVPASLSMDMVVALKSTLDETMVQQYTALGLAEEVQASAGGIRLESMFVDEGFGSLDDETLQQAMQALISLADGNRLVGIISHVAALREQIDTQLVVKKRPSGGSTAEIRLP